MKATMMKVSDPIIFGHAVSVILRPGVQETRRALRTTRSVDFRHGFGDLIAKIDGSTPAEERAGIEADIATALRRRARDRHGQLRPRHHQSPRPQRCHHRRLHARHDPRPPVACGTPTARPRTRTLAVIPDSSYAGVYQGGDRRSASPTAPSIPPPWAPCPERRPHGPESRRIRLPRQDLRDLRPWNDPRRGRRQAKTLFEHEVDTGDIWRMPAR